MWTRTNHWNIYYEVQGEGEPVLLIHGIPTSSFIWRKQVEALSTSFRVYALDLPGWGYSDKPSDFNYTIDAYYDFGVIICWSQTTGVNRRPAMQQVQFQ